MAYSVDKSVSVSSLEKVMLSFKNKTQNYILAKKANTNNLILGLQEDIEQFKVDMSKTVSEGSIMKYMGGIKSVDDIEEETMAKIKPGNYFIADASFTFGGESNE